MSNTAARPRTNRDRREVVRRIRLTAVAILITAAFVAGTPFLLLAVGHLRPNDWAQFSNEGQAYGGIAAVLGMLALVGVGASLILQARDAANNRELTQRTIHAELLSKGLEDPALLACWGPSLHGDPGHDRQHIYTNMIVQFWRSMFEIGKITEAQLHGLSAQMFASAPGRKYWSIAGPFQQTYYTSDKDTRFIEILEHEYRDAASGQPTARPPEPNPPLPAPTRSRALATTVTLGLIGGAILSGATAIVRRRATRTP